MLPQYKSEATSPSQNMLVKLFSRPRNLVLAFAVAFVLFFFMFSGSGPLMPEPGTNHDHSAPPGSHPPPPAGHGDPPAPNPIGNEPDGHGSKPGHSDEPPLGSGGDSSAWGPRAQSVKDAFKHAYGEYVKVGFGQDEILPMSIKPTNNFNGWGVSIIDSLDTMILMDLKDELAKGIEHVASLNITAVPQSVHFFETSIRYLGGYLAAYNLVNEPILLTQAITLANVLLRVFDTPSGLPGYSAPTRVHEGDQYTSGRVSMYLAEIGSCQVEFKYLAHLTGDARYWNAADNVTRIMHKTQSKSAIPGLWGTNWDINTGEPQQNQFTIGALSDSAYEYLLKQYLLSGRTEKYLLEMYIAATDAMIQNNIYLSGRRKLLYVTDVSAWNQGKVTPSGKLEHLSCFLPGLFALGANQLNKDELDDARRKKHLWAAEGLAYTCYAMYAEQRHGLGPEDVTFDASKSQNWGAALKDFEASAASKKDGAKPPGVANLAPLEKDFKSDRDYPYASSEYLLRPETIESVYLLWRTTKDDVWRERGWTMWEAVNRETRVDHGFASARNLGGEVISHSDSQPSYFLAETLKYYYLLFNAGDPWPLNNFTFNTEAHPLPVYQLRDWERRRFGVDSGK